jgi:hypothetical protein
MRFLHKILISSIVLLVTSGCASVNSVNTQKVRTDTDVPGDVAMVSNKNSGEKTAGALTPAVVYQASTYAVMAAPALQGNEAVVNHVSADITTALVVPSAAQSPPGAGITPGLIIKTIEFRTGVSSVTVEKMAKKVGCSGGKGAGLITPKAAVEVYRMVCDNGRTFVARCETRQCSVM